MYMVMSPLICMSNFRDYFRGNGRVWRNMEMVAKYESVPFTVSTILHTAQHGVGYHRETDPCLSHPTYCVIGPIGGPFMQ